MNRPADERLTSLEQSSEKLTARAGALEGTVVQLTESYNVLLERTTALEAGLADVQNQTAPNPHVAKVKGVIGSVAAYLWRNKHLAYNVVVTLLLFFVMASGGFQGCDGIKCDGIHCNLPHKEAPIAEKGLRFLFVYENEQKLTPDQQLILTDDALLNYLIANCAKDEKNRPEYRFFDQNTDVSKSSKLWQDAFARKRDGLPWLIISNGEDGYEGPPPATAAATLELVKKYPPIQK